MLFLRDKKSSPVLTISSQTPQLVTLTKDGDFTIQNHRLCHVNSPLEDSDASTKCYVDEQIKHVRQSTTVEIANINQAIDLKLVELKQSLDVGINSLIENTREGHRVAVKEIRDDINGVRKTRAKDITKLQNDLINTKLQIDNIYQIIGSEHKLPLP